MMATLERCAPGINTDIRALKWDPELLKYAAQLQWKGGQGSVSFVNGPGLWGSKPAKGDKLRHS
jgi:hypothetical protein